MGECSLDLPSWNKDIIIILTFSHVLSLTLSQTHSVTNQNDNVGMTVNSGLAAFYKMNTTMIRLIN